MACHYCAGSSVKLLCAVSFCDSNPEQEEVAPALGCRRTEGRSTARVHSALQRGPLQTPSGGLDPYLQVPCPLLHEKGVAGGSEVQAARTARAPHAHPARTPRKPHRTACRPPQAPLFRPSRSQEIRFPPVFVSLLRCLLQLCHFLKHPGGSMLRPTGSHGSSSPEPCTFSP